MPSSISMEEMEAAARAVADVKADLIYMAGETSVASRRSAYLRVKAALDRGRLFSLLYREPPSDVLSLAPTAQNSLIEAVTTSLNALAIFYEIGSRPEYASLARRGYPVTIERLFSWIDCVHPVNSLGQGAHWEISPVGALSLVLLRLGRNRPAELAEYLGQCPHALFLVTDLWLHYPAYMRGADSGQVEVSTTTSLMMSRVLRIMSSDEHQLAVLSVLEQFRGRSSPGRHILKCIGAQTQFLSGVTMTSDWRWAYQAHFPRLAGPVRPCVRQLPPAIWPNGKGLQSFRYGQTWVGALSGAWDGGDDSVVGRRSRSSSCRAFDGNTQHV
ncbi:hypothetical protein BD626DRAFT_543765 [Schizophyllum amplum]|uniref:Uncharacterized protein n=1 Tax=Schizophyllum amplum TaxID=97359 RepID=A0A550BRH6_9AGAR|nr:hypothetical protein BD626DRAFT_543765 [Auriculariopsis ampla]